MTTTYPVTLLPVDGDPEAAWNAVKADEDTFVRPDDGRPFAVTSYLIDAGGREEAELRVLTWIDHSYEDDLRGAKATGVREVAAGRWLVSLQVFGEF
ncbi:hypothetical protein ACFPC0_10940 [Streptomyces andamanensis]|uniref:Uncharacterized protein n=1 Tax=Streptomyces andamanensis TaxID=1565035 RepID=A0ABV8TCG9_9ACTN